MQLCLWRREEAVLRLQLWSWNTRKWCWDTRRVTKNLLQSSKPSFRKQPIHFILSKSLEQNGQLTQTGLHPRSVRLMAGTPWHASVWTTRFAVQVILPVVGFEGFPLMWAHHTVKQEGEAGIFSSVTVVWLISGRRKYMYILHLVFFLAIKFVYSHRSLLSSNSICRNTQHLHFAIVSTKPLDTDMGQHTLGLCAQFCCYVLTAAVLHTVWPDLLVCYDLTCCSCAMTWPARVL